MGELQSGHGAPLGDRFLKVNHAGEHGAANIYTGQIIASRILYPELVRELHEFREHERHHRTLFMEELSRREQRRCRSYHLCGIGGFILGLMSGVLGRSAIGTTTVAVEQVVLKHLAHQIDQLRGSDTAAVKVISAIMEDEQSHHDRSLVHIREGSIWRWLLFPLVARSTEAVIWIGMRI